jgi:hypothetical protein
MATHTVRIWHGIKHNDAIVSEFEFKRSAAANNFVDELTEAGFWIENSQNRTGRGFVPAHRINYIEIEVSR